MTAIVKITAYHTPTPWRVHDMERDSIVEDKTGHAIALVYGRRFTEHTNAGNLDFIIRAVNSHDALVDALYAFVKTKDLWGAADGECAEEHRGEVECLRGLLDKAVTALEGVK